MNSVSNDVIDKIIKIVKDGGGEIYDEKGYINFIGVRNNVTNDTFNDTLYILWKDETDGNFKCVQTNGFTTKPGKKVVLNEDGKTNYSGAAILKEGWHKNCWHIGKHQNKYKALRQTDGVTDPIVITRDRTQFGNKGHYELRIFTDSITAGFFGINFHKSGSKESKGVNGWSAGCQVFKKESEFKEMLTMAEYASSKGQKTFSYFLTNKSVFDNSDVGDSDVETNTTYNFDESQFAGQVQSDESSTNETSSQYSNNVSGLGSSETGTVETISSYTSVPSSSSFGNKIIFGEVFPDDDNNRYIEMSSEEIAITQYSEPVLAVEELKISNKAYVTTGIVPDKISFHTPIVFINDFMIPQTNITNFCLDYSSFTPQVMVEFVDMTNVMLSTNIPKPGSYIKVYIGGNGDEKYYKPIRQDFVITNINKTNKTGGDYQNLRYPIKYKFTGILNVPLGFRKMPWSSSKINARQAMFNISNTIGLGFATNYNINSDIDVMKWVNTQNKSYFDFMKDITKHSCYSPYTFFTSFIDQYYVLNFVECRRLLSHGGDKTDVPQMIYNCIMPNLEGENNETEELNNGDQKISYYFLSNSDEFKGWTNYIEEYYELNDGYSMMSDGYSKTLTYSDKCGFPNLMSKNYKFLLMPIDNIRRDEERNIESLPPNVGRDSYIPLNLRQTTNSEYINNQYLYDSPTAAESTIDLGEVDTSNNFPLYFYASVQNDFQMKNLKKCGLSIRLENYNPSITKYSRIWIDIYDKHKNSSENIKQNPMVDEMENSKVKDYLKERNDNIISYKEEREHDNEYQVYNRSLSGWYVITDMKIIYNTIKDFKGKTYKKLQTQLVLNRIEYKPTFHTEYELARKGIEKYKCDNLSENIMLGGDLM